MMQTKEQIEYLCIKFIICNSCGNLLDVEPVINKGAGVVYTCICGYKTGIKKGE